MIASTLCCGAAGTAHTPRMMLACISSSTERRFLIARDSASFCRFCIRILCMACSFGSECGLPAPHSVAKTAKVRMSCTIQTHITPPFQVSTGSESCKCNTNTPRIMFCLRSASGVGRCFNRKSKRSESVNQYNQNTPTEFTAATCRNFSTNST